MSLNSEKIKISIVTVCFNSVKTLEQTILSIINQTYKNIEYIIIDGASSDGTVELIKKYKDHISYWLSEPDNGIYEAMNKGIAKATGDYIYFIGADDFLYDEYTLAKVVNELEESIDILSSPVLAVRDELALQRIYKNRVTNEQITDGYVIPHQGMFVKKQLMNKFKFDESYRIAADYDFFLKCYLSNQIKIKFIDRLAAFYSLGGISATNTMIQSQEHISVMEKYSLNGQIIKELKQQISQPLIKQKPLKVFLLSLLKWFGLYRFVFTKKFPEWSYHSCNWKFCRWCNK